MYQQLSYGGRVYKDIYLNAINQLVRFVSAINTITSRAEPLLPDEKMVAGYPTSNSQYSTKVNINRKRSFLPIIPCKVR